MKPLFTLIFCLACLTLFAQQKQFLLIVRSKAVMQASPDEIKTNIQHWTAYMGNLGKAGKIAGGYRPGQEGALVWGPAKTTTDKPYIVNGEMVSSFLIINAADMSEAKKIAADCPVYELNGSVEVRPLQNTAN